MKDIENDDIARKLSVNFSTLSLPPILIKLIIDHSLSKYNNKYYFDQEVRLKH